MLDGGYEAVFLDIDEVAGIHPGSRWRDELSCQLRTADAVVYLGSSYSERSVWCTAELAVAKALEKLILPVQIETGARHELLTDDQWVMYRSTVDDALSRLIHELDRSPDTLAHRRSWDNRRSPFPGLCPFTDADAGVFFGRDAAIEELVRMTNPVSLLDHGSLVAVVGPSGTGKSSLVRAGLIRNLSAQRPPKATWLVIPPIVPSVTTRRDLGRAFAVAGAEPALADSVGRGNIGLSDAVETLARMRTPPVDRVLIVLDQAEELCAQPDRLEILQMLLEGARAGSGCRVVVTVREGYFSRLFSDVEIAGRVATLPLSPLDRPALGYSSQLGTLVPDPVAAPPSGTISSSSSTATATSVGPALPTTLASTASDRPQSRSPATSPVTALPTALPPQTRPMPMPSALPTLPLPTEVQPGPTITTTSTLPTPEAAPTTNIEPSSPTVPTGSTLPLAEPVQTTIDNYRR